MIITNSISILVNSEINNREQSKEKSNALFSRNPDRNIFHTISQKLDLLDLQINEETNDKAYIKQRLEALSKSYRSLAMEMKKSYAYGVKGSIKQLCSTGINLLTSKKCMNSAELIEIVATKKTEKLIEKLNNLII